MDAGVLDGIINRLIGTKENRPTKQVQLLDAEIRQLCLVSKSIFLQEPNLLEIEAPVKICGKYYHFLVTDVWPQFFYCLCYGCL